MFKVQFTKLVLAVLVLGAVALIAPSPARAQDSEKVVVMNTKENPVPTTAVGTTTVNGTVTVGNSAAAPVQTRNVDAASATHLGRKASEFVSLSGLFDMSGNVFFLRSLPNGDATPFTVPAGKVLVITDIQWQIDSGNPGTVSRLALNVENVANPGLTRRVYNSVLTLNTAGVNNVTDSLTSGILVSSAAQLKANLTIPTGALGGLFLIGYLVPEQ